MKKRLIYAATLLTGLMMPVASHSIGIALDAGTTGAGGHLVFPVIDHQLNARLGLHTFSFRYDGQTDDVSYQFKLKLQTYDALLDYYPFNGAFRVTAGGMVNQTRVTAHANTHEFTLNGHTYTRDEVGSLSGRIDFKKYVPYLGLGWGNAVAAQKGWGFTSDIGILFQGAPRSSLQSNGCQIDAAACRQFQQDVDTENNKMRDKVKNIKYYPVLRMGITYRF